MGRPGPCRGGFRGVPGDAGGRGGGGVAWAERADRSTVRGRDGASAAGEVGLDRRGPIRRPGDTGVEFRTWRS